MKKAIFLPICAACIMLLGSCNQPAKTDAVEAPAAATPKADPAQIRADIVAAESAWADALNKKDITALMALYTDDAVSMAPGEPTLVGKAAIQKHQEAEWLQKSKSSSTAFETQDVYGQGDVVTEVGKTISKDADGKIVYTGKYMAVFVKQDGKYLCIREIYNEDSK